MKIRKCDAKDRLSPRLRQPSVAVNCSIRVILAEMTPIQGGEIIRVRNLQDQEIPFEVSPELARHKGFRSDLETCIAARIAVFDAPRLLSLKAGRLVSEREAYFEYASALMSWRDLYSHNGKAYKALVQTLSAARIWLNPAYFFLPLLAHRRLLRHRKRSLNLELALIALAKTLLRTPDQLIACMKTGRIGVTPDLFEQHRRFLNSPRLSLYLNASIQEVEDALLLYAIRFAAPLPRFRENMVDIVERLRYLWKFVSKLEEYKQDDPWHLVSLTQKALNPDMDIKIFPDDIALS